MKVKIVLKTLVLIFSMKKIVNVKLTSNFTLFDSVYGRRFVQIFW